MQNPILIIMAYVIGIHGKKRAISLALISHKYSQRNTNLGIMFCHRCENQKVKKLNAVWKIMVLVKNWGKPIVVKTTNFHIYLTVSHNITQSTKKDMLTYVFLQGTYNQLTTPRFYVQVLVLFNTAYF